MASRGAFKPSRRKAIEMAGTPNRRGPGAATAPDFWVLKEIEIAYGRKSSCENAGNGSTKVAFYCAGLETKCLLRRHQNRPGIEADPGHRQRWLPDGPLDS